VAVGIIFFIFMQLKEKKNKRLAESCEDKARKIDFHVLRQFPSLQSPGCYGII